MFTQTKYALTAGVLSGSFLLLLTANAHREPRPHALRISVNNDFFNFRASGTDRYFTNGVRLDYYYSGKKPKRKFPDNLLPAYQDERADNSYSWGLAQFMFTPSDISIPEIQYNDRPYAGALYAIHSLQSIKPGRKEKLETEIYLGVLGPMSLAGETQKWIHKKLNYTIPQGWSHQIPNDLILNYNISVEKQLINPSPAFSVSGTVESFSGTLYNAAGVGFTIKAGRMNDAFDIQPLSSNVPKKKTRVFIFIRPTGRIVLSNAILEGGLISKITNNRKGYTIEKDQIERLTLLYDTGLVIGTDKFSFMISQQLRTAEFKGQQNHEVGHLVVQFRL